MKEPVGRIRWILGIVLIALGVILWADMVFLLAFFGSAFGYVEWIRFCFWLWVGAMLALAGSWLAFRSRVALWASGVMVLLVLLLVTVGFVQKFGMR